jgi:transposase
MMPLTAQTNGMVEGCVNNAKLLNRPGYGGVGFALLRWHVLAA